MGMTLEDTRIMNMLNSKKDVVAVQSASHPKTIFGVNKMREEDIKKVIDIEAEWFIRTNPGYLLGEVRVQSKGNNTVTYKMIFIKP